MSDNFTSWVERVAADREAKPLAAGEMVKSSAAEPFGAIAFVTVRRPGFKVELGKKGDQYIYHFYPNESLLGALIFNVYEPMTEALLQAFKSPDQIEADWVEEMKSYAVRVSGWANTVWGDDLAVRVIDIFEEKLKERNPDVALTVPA